MDVASQITGEVVTDYDDTAAESLLALMADDPTLAANTVADVLDAAAEVYNDPDAAVSSQLLHGIVNELNATTRVFLEALIDAARRQQVFQERMAFLDWIMNSQPLDADPLVRKLLNAADQTSWPEPETYSEYREYLTTMLARGEISENELEYFRTALWPQYVADGLAMVGDEYSTRQEWRYSIEIRWDDGHRERPAEAANGVSRLDAERIYRNAAIPDRAGNPVLQRRFSVHGPWVDVR